MYTKLILNNHPETFQVSSEEDIRRIISRLYCVEPFQVVFFETTKEVGLTDKLGELFAVIGVVQ